MSKDVRERLDRQLADVDSLIAEMNEISARLKAAADAAVETLNDDGHEGERA